MLLLSAKRRKMKVDLSLFSKPSIMRMNNVHIQRVFIALTFMVLSEAFHGMIEEDR